MPRREGELIARALAALPRVGAVVLSDYAKGVLTPRVIARGHRSGASKLGKPVIVDPKGSDYSVYRGATLITPNRKELAEATRLRGRQRRRGRGRGGRARRAIVGSEAVLVTRSEDGMTLLHARAARRSTCRPIR